MIYFVGDEPSFLMEPGAKPFVGAACEKRLHEWIKYVLDISDLEFLILRDNSFTIINREDISHWDLLLMPPFVNVYMKKNIFISLGKKADQHISIIEHFALPHPSGLNRQVNDKEFIKSELNKCKKYIKEKLIKNQEEK